MVIFHDGLKFMANFPGRFSRKTYMIAMVNHVFSCPRSKEKDTVCYGKISHNTVTSLREFVSCNSVEVD
jgi:hypothetical protein